MLDAECRGLQMASPSCLFASSMYSWVGQSTTLSLLSAGLIIISFLLSKFFKAVISAGLRLVLLCSGRSYKSNRSLLTFLKKIDLRFFVCSLEAPKFEPDLNLFGKVLILLVGLMKKW